MADESSNTEKASNEVSNAQKDDLFPLLNQWLRKKREATDHEFEVHLISENNQDHMSRNKRSAVESKKQTEYEYYYDDGENKLNEEGEKKLDLFPVRSNWDRHKRETEADADYADDEEQESESEEISESDGQDDKKQYLGVEDITWDRRKRQIKVRNCRDTGINPKLIRW